jgi:predicted transcriptional regulator
MAMTVTKKIRMDDEMAAALAELAKEEGVTESEVVREAIRGEIRLMKRKKNIHLLVQMAIDVPGDDSVMNWKGKL